MGWHMGITVCSESLISQNPYGKRRHFVPESGDSTFFQNHLVPEPELNITISRMSFLLSLHFPEFQNDILGQNVIFPNSVLSQNVTSRQNGVLSQNVILSQNGVLSHNVILSMNVILR